MNQKTLRKVGYVALIVALLLMGINKYLDYQWEKESREFNAQYDAILQHAIESKNVTLCKNHNFKLRCVSQVGIRTNNATVCEEFYKDDLRIVTCKAIVLDDINYCDGELKNLDQKTCREAIGLMKKDISLI